MLKPTKAKSSGLTPKFKFQVDCVLNILIESIEKLQIVFTVLQMVEEFGTTATTRRFSEQWQLTPAENEKCLQLLAEAIEYVMQQKLEAQSEPTPIIQMYQLIDLLYRKTPKSQSKREYNDEDKQLLDLFNDLFDISEQRLNKSTLSELNRQKLVHQLRHEHATLQKSIEVSRVRLKRQSNRTRWQLAFKSVLIQKYEEDLAIKKWDNNVRIKQEVVKSAKRIHEIHSISLEKQKELQMELQLVKAAYEKARKNNLELEHKARDEKNDLLLQLQTLIKKFDQTIGDKIKESMTLRDEYDEKKGNFDAFLKEFEREELEYFEIVRQKEDEERRQHQQRVLLFMMNRAARNVQRYWRKYRRDLKKKSKKKGKGKKKS